jgi:hypothetical protein
MPQARKPPEVRQLQCTGVVQEPLDERTSTVIFRTNHRDLVGRFHPVPKESAIGAAIWVGGSGGGLDGPARGLYPAACKELQSRKVAGLRLDYRYPNHLEECVLDVLLGIEFLNQQGVFHVVLVGHSFGGAVVITAGAASPMVHAVVPMSTQSYGVESAAELSPRSLLLIHGTDDEILSYQCSRYVYRIAHEPKELRLFEGARHGLDEAREEILGLLVTWIPEKLSKAGDAGHL